MENQTQNEDQSQDKGLDQNPKGSSKPVDDGFSPFHLQDLSPVDIGMESFELDMSLAPSFD